jgi:hypothetical protein
MRFKINRPYHIKFYDHFIGNNDDEIVCEVLGWVVSSGKNYVRISYWNTISKMRDRDSEEHNREFMKILKSAIIDARVVSF